MQGAAGIAGWLARLHALRTRPAIPPMPSQPGGAEATPSRPGPSWL
jgi:hypothetical protein